MRSLQRARVPAKDSWVHSEGWHEICKINNKSKAI